jgi:hypothetical protein
MARLQVADRGNGLQIWRVAANILKKQLRTADRGWPSSLGVGWGCCEVRTRASKMDGFSGTTQAPEKGYEVWHVECQELL